MDWSESSKDLLIAFTAETEEWATYLQTVLKGTVKENSIFFYCLGTLQLQQADALCLSAYKCKLLIASKGLMKRLTEIMRFHLARILHPPESVVIFLCGIESTDKLYSLVPIEKRCWELSCDQDPQEFVQLICSVIQQGISDLFSFTLLYPSVKLGKVKKTSNNNMSLWMYSV
ncbi:B-cell scaffold protein with ankyrin repeats-like [Protopterus annectens]|uniref:B-cell scaffold protein with ankyrin repeats-like n=1 Tax=Protopterus annectens TaxID=7888 RepID=UPI001CFAA499|nr:B-cell scaffold protein with ankyrin repeats-like [Protopterus annectens]